MEMGNTHAEIPTSNCLFLIQGVGASPAQSDLYMVISSIAHNLFVFQPPGPVQYSGTRVYDGSLQGWIFVSAEHHCTKR